VPDAIPKVLRDIRISENADYLPKDWHVLQLNVRNWNVRRNFAHTYEPFVKWLPEYWSNAAVLISRAGAAKLANKPINRRATADFWIYEDVRSFSHTGNLFGTERREIMKSVKTMNTTSKTILNNVSPIASTGATQQLNTAAGATKVNPTSANDHIAPECEPGRPVKRVPYGSPLWTKGEPLGKGPEEGEKKDKMKMNLKAITSASEEENNINHLGFNSPDTSSVSEMEPKNSNEPEALPKTLIFTLVPSFAVYLEEVRQLVEFTPRHFMVCVCVMQKTSSSSINLLKQVVFEASLKEEDPLSVDSEKDRLTIFEVDRDYFPKNSPTTASTSKIATHLQNDTTQGGEDDIAMKKMLHKDLAYLRGGESNESSNRLSKWAAMRALLQSRTHSYLLKKAEFVFWVDADLPLVAFPWRTLFARMRNAKVREGAQNRVFLAGLPREQYETRDGDWGVTTGGCRSCCFSTPSSILVKLPSTTHSILLHFIMISFIKNHHLINEPLLIWDLQTYYNCVHA